MSTRAEIITLVRLAPDIDTTALSDANLRIILGRGQIDLAMKGRALPKNEKVNLVANQREYVLSGASSVLTGNDFLAIDLREGGVLFSDGTNWFGRSYGFTPTTREWLDLNRPGWRTAAAASTHNYWYVGTGEDNVANLVVGLVDKPSASRTDGLWVHWLARGVLPTDDTHYFWTGSTTQLVHLEPYEILLCYYAWEFYHRNIAKNDVDADKHKLIYEQGAKAMADRLPLEEHLTRDGIMGPSYFEHLGGRRRY